MLAKMQTSKNRGNIIQENDRDDPHEKVRVLQLKLDEAVSKIYELTDVLGHLNKEFDTERYYEETAKEAADAAAKGRTMAGTAAGAASYGGAASQVGRPARSSLPTES